MMTIFLYSSFYDQVRHNPIYIQADELEDAIDSNNEMFQYPTHQYPLTYEEQRGARVKELKSHYEQQDLSGDEGSNEYAIVLGLEDDPDVSIEPRGSQLDSNIYNSISKDTIMSLLCLLNEITV